MLKNSPDERLVAACYRARYRNCFGVRARSFRTATGRERLSSFSALRDLNPFRCAKGQLLLSVSPPFWDFEDDEDPVILEIVSEERQKLPPAMFLDFGPSLPGRYGVDQLELMTQSPMRVFAYWELKEATLLAALHSVSVQDRPNFQLLLKWKEKDAATERCLDPGTTASWWFDTLPENRYQLEIGLYWGEYGWLPLLASRELVTPRLALGPAAEEEPPLMQAFLESLVQQTGIGLQQERAQASSQPGELETPSPAEESMDATAQSTLRLEEARQGGVTPDVRPLQFRPTSRW